MEVALSPKSAANRADHPRRYQFYCHVSCGCVHEGYNGVLGQNTAGRRDRGRGANTTRDDTCSTSQDEKNARIETMNSVLTLIHMTIYGV